MAARLGNSRAAASAISATMVFIAPTQSGKSKAIDEFHIMQGQPRPSASGLLQVGNGKQSCTSSPMLLPPFHVHYLKLNTWEPQNTDLRRKIEKLTNRGGRSRPGASEKFSEEMCEALCDFRVQWKGDQAWKAGVELDISRPVSLQVKDTGLCPLQLRCLDTPGLDDSFGRDDEHMENILSAMGAPEVGNIIAFVFLAKSGQPFSDRFLKTVQRYWDQFPSFRHNWIFLHTAMDPSRTDYDDDSCFEHEIDERRWLLVQSLERVCNDKDGVLRTLPHIFVDNVIPDGRKVAKDPSLLIGLEMKKAAKAEAHNELLLNVASNKPVPVQNLSYRKSEAMQRIDENLIGQFRAYKLGLLETLEALECQHTRLMGKYTKSVERLAELQGQVAQTQQQLDSLDTDELVCAAQRRPHRPWRLLGNDETITIPSKIPIAHRDITCASAYASSQAEDLGVEEVGGGTFVWKVRISSPPLRGCEVVLKIFTEKRHKHQNEIKRLSKIKDQQVIDRRTASQAQDQMEVDISSVKNEMGKLKRRIELFTHEEAALHAKEIPLPTYLVLKDFYRSACGGDEALVRKYFEAKGMHGQYASLMKR